MEKRIGRALSALLLWTVTASGAHYRFRHFGPDEGLNTAVSRILQDRTGFLWIGTGNGLYRYDGAHFQRFGAEDGLPSPSIRALREAPDGVLWVATGLGLARFDRERFRSVDTGPAGRDSRALDIGPDGTVYLGFDHGLLAAPPPQNNSPPAFAPVHNTAAEQVNGILAEPNGSVWFNCGLKLCLLKRGEVRSYDGAAGLPAERWGALLRDHRGNLWLRGPQHLFMLPPGASRFVPRDQGLAQSSNSALSLIEDRGGEILVSTDRGLARLRNGRWLMTGIAQGLQSETVTSVLEDREGSLWLGLWGAGLVRWPNPAEWTSWTAADGLPNEIVWAVKRDRSGTILAGTDHGLVRLQEGAPQMTWSKREGLGGDKVKALVIAPDGAVWAASLPGGVSRIDPKSGRVQVFGAAAGLEDDRVIGLHLDRENRLWASTDEGLFRSNGLGPALRFERETPPGTSTHTMFYRFLNDRAGRVWVGSADGLFRFDAGRWTRFGAAQGLKADGVTHVAEAADGAIWIAYREPAGVSRLESGSGPGIRHFTQRDGLPSDYVLFLGFDSQQRLWAGTDNGVAVQQGSKWKILTHEDGLIWDDCAANAFLAEADGTVWIGTLKGLSRYRPDPQPLSPAPPAAVVTSVRFGPRAADPANLPEVPFREHDFQVAFAGLTFLSEKNVRFRYQLEGLDEGWIETGQHEARYPSLPPGAYHFRVAARLAEGRWSQNAASVRFRILPPWWSTWWFRAISVGAGLLLLWLIVRSRVQRIRGEHQRLERSVQERTAELQLQKSVVERQKREIEGLLRDAQEISRLKSEFLANMSHEIRTPMNGVIGMTQLVLSTSLDDDQRDCISTVRDSAESLLVVINDILDFSKIEAGKMELSRESFVLNKCVQDALAMFTWKAQEKGLRLTCEISPEVPPLVYGDSDRLRQILLNLLGNAMKFTEVGAIALTVEPDRRHPGDLHFAVRDTGIGIEEEKQGLVFQAFAQADGSSRRRQGGTGLGLAICSKLVELMQGTIWVESTPGAGSTFHFTARLGEAAEDTKRTQITPRDLRAAACGIGVLRILLAEDNLVNQKLAQRAIQKMGHEIVVVENGRLAVEAAANGHFDVILMDLQMPEMDGFEATAAIRRLELDTGRHTPVIAMTAHAMHGDRENCLRAGFDDYISKPVDLLALARLIEKARGQPAS